MEATYTWFEEAIQALEKMLGCRVTIIDHQGLFHTKAGLLIFPRERQSHRELPVCNSGFCDRCIDFCRHEMNRQCRQRHTAFNKTCWKGITEIVVPLRQGEEHWGMFYLGAWQTRNFVREKEAFLPPEFDAYYQALPCWSEDRFRAMAPLLEAFSAGLVARLTELNAIGEAPLDRAGQIKSYFTRNAGNPEASLSALAAAISLSPSRTSRLLKLTFGRSFSSLMNETRIKRAKVLLLSSSNKLAVIAAATGFGDEYHFSKVFRQLEGIPPGLFRREHNQSSSGQF